MVIKTPETIQLEEKILDKYKSVNPEYYENFKSNISIIKELTYAEPILNKEVSPHLFNMLYSYAITSLETYLSDAFMDKVKNNKQFLISFVETFEEFKKNKFSFSDIFAEYEKIDDTVTEALLGVIYHNLPKIKGMYEATFGIKFPDIASLTKAVLKRHDFVHRCGKNKEGKNHKLETQEINALCDEILEFVEEIHLQLEFLNIREQNIDDYE